MEVTRRYWVTVALAGVLVLWAFVLERPVLLVGTAIVLAWLLTRQYRFVHTTTATVDDMRVHQRCDRTRVTAEETTVGSLTVTSPVPVDGSVRVDANPPVGSTATPASCELTHGGQTAETTFEVTWPIAGSFTFGAPTVTITDPLQLFSQTLTAGPTPSVTVEPRAPRDIHIGEGGDPIAAGFGEHDAGRTGSGLTPAEVRAYVPGDNIQQIDWNATARLNEPHVREFEAETDLETLLIVDHRATMGTGHEGETQLDFARQVALGILESAQALGDPVGWYGVGDGGLTATFTPSTDTAQYRTIAQRLRDLELTQEESVTSQTQMLTPADARRTADKITGESPFERRLRPFFDAAETYVQRVAEQPLFEALRTASARLGGTVRTIIITNDQRRAELRETVKLARQGNGHVVVFLTPSVLYEQQPVSAVDESYRRYTEFEEFRRELAALSRVSAFEVGPSDRLASVLSAGSNQRESKQ